MSDSSCLAEGYVVPADFALTGVNLNEIIVGATGSGKSFSNAYSRLVHTNQSSLVVPIAKKALKEQFAGMFRDRGYKVIDMDFTHPENSSAGYDPLDYIQGDEDVIQLARNMIHPDKERRGADDPYWEDSAASVLAAEINIVRLNAEYAGRKPCFEEVIDLHRSLRCDTSNGLLKTNLDDIFDEAERRYPGNQASLLWKTVSGLAVRTASCILSMVNSAFDKIFSEKVIAMTKKDGRVDFKELGERRTVLFVTTSPMNNTVQNLVNLLYADLFRVLFEAAEQNPNGSLKVPVHIICDDFACGCRIRNFEDFISIFRAAHISVTLLLQSESQLNSMYGEYAATTIINNCDTYVYMGGLDITTCQHISQRLNKPVSTIVAMPLEQVIVFRRGRKPVVSRRYQTFEDSVYREVMEKYRNQNEPEQQEGDEKERENL